jgi:glycosyltransferase involved in cell wall biosynthesis
MTSRARSRRAVLVTVLCSRRGYDGGGPYASRETADGVAIRRLAGVAFGRGGPARIASHLAFLVQALPRILAGRRPDVVLTMTSPPYVGLLGALASRLRAVRHAHWAMDLYPDVLEAHGVSGGALHAILGWLARWQMRGTRLAIAPSSSMAHRLGERAGTPVETVPLWTRASGDDADAAALRRDLGWPANQLVLLYAGNMGLGHRFEEFLDAARALGPDGPAWLFAGGGPRRSELAAAEGLVRLLPYASADEHHRRCRAAAVHLMSLRAAWDGLVVPSKLQAAFGAGRPVIFVGSRVSEPGRWIDESGGGWVVAEGDTPGLLRAIAEAGDPAERTRRGRAGRDFASERFDPIRNVARMVELLERIGA